MNVERAMTALRGAYPGERCWIVGKGPSLRYLRREHFGAGPVIAINTALKHVQGLNLPNPLYLLEKDGRLGDFMELREDVTVILQEGFSDDRFMDHQRRLVIEPVLEMGFEATEMSARMAARLAMEMGCVEVVFVCCDSLTMDEFGYVEMNGEVRPGDAGAYKRLRKIVLRDSKDFPYVFFVPRLVDVDGLREEYDRLFEEDPNRWAHAGHDGEVFEAVKEFGAPVRLLDIGCGNGHTIEYFARQWPFTDYTGLDVSERAVQLARKRAPNARFICGALEEAKLVGGYDMVLMVGVAEHLADPLVGLRKMRTMMKAGGMAYLEVPNCLAYPTAEKGEGFRRIRQGNRQKEWHLYRSTWEWMIGEAGLETRRAISGSSVYNEFVWLLTSMEGA